MKRFILGVVWFFVLLFVITLAFTIPASMTAKPEAGMSEQEVGYAAGGRVQQKYGPFFVIAALGLAVFGTYRGILPGTKKREDIDG